MLDLTKEIVLQPRSRTRYDIARVLLYAAFCAGVLFTAHRILFPSVSLVFSFDNARSLKNTLVSPRTASGNDVKKPIAAGDTLIFNANPVGNFSEAEMILVTDKNSPGIEGVSVRLRKSYRAFFFPEDEPIGFRDGTMLTTDDGSYYIVSDGGLRRFSNTDIILRLGYSKGAFLPVSKDDLRHNNRGADITDADTYPDDTFFAIGDTYYGLKDRQLFPFVSTRAFFSQHDAIDAIIKNDDFLDRYEVAETALGFADGTLGSSDQSVYILSQGKSYPVADVATFLSMGFDFNDVIALDGEEMGAYERQKQFTRDQPHPDGTLFSDRKTGGYSVVEKNKKRPIGSAAVAKTYSKQKPVLADSAESEKNVSCRLEKASVISNEYACHTPLASIAGLPGNSYQIDAALPGDAVIKNIDVTFYTPLARENLRSSLSLIKERLKNNYISQ